jgi:translocation and assembly module TamA
MTGTVARLGAILASLLLSACASLGGLFENSGKPAADTAADSGPQKIAYELQIEAPDELRALLQEHLDLARFQRIGAGERLSRIELDRLSAAAPAQARALLETEGYFNANVDFERLPGEDQALQRVRLKVSHGPRTRVSRLDLSFAGALQEPVGAEAEQLAARLRRQLLRDWTLQAGQPFRQSTWSSAKTEALATARAGGYALARWTHTAARVQAESNEAELELLLDSGPLLRLGELRIEGLKHYDEDVVRRLAGFEPGLPYTERGLLDFQERLLQTQLFDAVTVDILAEGAQAEAVPVVVRLREAPRQQATTGIGYNADTGQRVTLEHLHRAPFGLPMRALSKLDLGRDLRSASLELTSHPQTDMQRNVASVALEEDLSDATPVTSLTGRIGRLRETLRDERLYYLEAIRSHEHLSSGTVRTGANSINGQWTRRRVDSTLLPTRGHTAQLQLGLGRADSSNGPSGAFGRVDVQLAWYQPLAQRSWFFSTRMEVGQVLVRDAVGVPDKLLFRAGGDDSVRGYAYHSLGPTVDGEDVGGRVTATGSIEIARPISSRMPSLWGAAFIDAGQAADRWNELNPYLGYGVGLRWRSPVGALRMDLARGHELRQWRLHFSVGVSL